MDRRVFIAFLFTVFAAMTTVAADSAAAGPKVRFETTLGAFVIELDPAKAPASAENFLAYVKDGHYDGTIFHRVIPGFMAQGGGYTEGYREKRGKPPILNESRNGLRNLRGTVAMARTSDPHSATAQFFVNVVDNAFLDAGPRHPGGWGYAVFGKVIEGMETVDKMVAAPAGRAGPFDRDAPKTPIVITSAKVAE